MAVSSILEYLNRDDADRAVKDLDGKDLRGRPVRVALDDTVRIIDIVLFSMIAYASTCSAVVQTIIDAKIAMSVLVKTDPVMTDTGTTVTTTTATTGMIVLLIAVTVPDRLLLVAQTTMIVAPGLHPPGGRMIEGLQGTIMTVMTGGEVIMTKPLIMIMIDAGTIMIDPREGTTEDATRRMGVPSTKGPLGTEMAVGRAKIAHGFRDVGPDRKWTTSVFWFFLPESIGLQEIWR
jgi:hypothetical protein